MSRGMEVGLGPGDVLLYGDPDPPTTKGLEPPIFDPRLLWRYGYGCMDQDATGYGAMPTQHCVRWGPSSPPLKGHTPHFRSMSFVAKRLNELCMPFASIEVYGQCHTCNVFPEHELRDKVARVTLV